TLRAEQTLDVFDEWRLYLLEAVALVDRQDPLEQMAALEDLFREKVAHATWWNGSLGHRLAFWIRERSASVVAVGGRIGVNDQHAPTPRRPWKKATLPTQGTPDRRAIPRTSMAADSTSRYRTGRNGNRGDGSTSTTSVIHGVTRSWSSSAARPPATPSA